MLIVDVLAKMSITESFRFMGCGSSAVASVRFSRQEGLKQFFFVFLLMEAAMSCKDDWVFAVVAYFRCLPHLSFTFKYL